MSPRLDPMIMRLTLTTPSLPKLGKSTLSPNECKATENFLQENLDCGKICPSNSSQASPFFFVKKKDGSLCPCQDYCYLNKHTVPDAYPLSLISDLIDKLKDAKLCTKFDVWWGYTNIHIKDGHQWKAAFITHEGLFEPTVMFFRLTNCWSISDITYLVVLDYLIIATSHTSFYLSLLSDLLSILQVMSPSTS